MLDVGDAAPDFELPDQNSESVSLSEFRGKQVILYFYPRADTPGCTTEAQGFRDEYEAFEAHDAVVVGVSDDPVRDIEPFAEKYDLPFHLLSDESGDAARSYDSYGEKNMYGRTFDGVFRNTYVIDPEGTIEHAYEGVSPEGHAEEILTDLD